jgi:hypothetical protein
VFGLRGLDLLVVRSLGWGGGGGQSEGIKGGEKGSDN